MGSPFSAKIRQTLGLSGLPDSHIQKRSQGCWNCRHFDNEKAKKVWWDNARGAMLQAALKAAMEAPMGEEDPRVRNIRENVPQLDVGIENKLWGWCDKGFDAAGNNTEFVQSTYMCRKYEAAQGASVAREGGKMDELPSDIMQDVNAPGALDK